jgi:hypothetical protein
MRTQKYSLALLLGTLLATPLAARVPNPIQAAKDAYKKARQQQQASAKPPAAQPAEAQGADGQPAANTNTVAPAVPFEPARIPDVVGVRIGMSPQEALQILHKQYPGDRKQDMVNQAWPSAQKPFYGFNIIQTDPLGTADAYLSLTAPPGPQIVWRITRFTHRVHTNRAVFLAALREKYGKESMAFAPGGGPGISDDKQIGHLVWLFDESGKRIPLPPVRFFPGYSTIWDCGNAVGGLNPQPLMPENEIDTTRLFPGWCANYVGIRVTLSGDSEIIENTSTELMDVPLAIRTAHNATVWKNDLANRARQADIEKSKQSKPDL